jgi:hypothetical protein
MKVDVLAVMDELVNYLWNPFEQDNQDEKYKRAVKARSAVAELIEAAKLVNGDHVAPHDCYATGPLTGTAYLDPVRCPGCQLSAALSTIRSTL